MKLSLITNFFPQRILFQWFARLSGFSFFFKSLLVLLLVCLLNSAAVAGHFKGGQISYRFVGDGVYEVTIKSYWIEGTEETIFPYYTGPSKLLSFPSVVSKTLLPDGTTVEQVQEQRVSWSEPGTYSIYWETCCRAVGSNFDNNDIGIFSQVNYNPNVPSSSPQLFGNFNLNFKSGEYFEYMINMEDPERHEQEYTLEIPYGLAADAYDLMLASGFQVTNEGTILWENPQVGTWLFTMKLSEKINGVKTGSYINVDYMLKIAEDNGNKAPVFEALTDQTVRAGQLLSFEIAASDAERQDVRLVSNGSPYDEGAVFRQTVMGGQAKGQFEWTPEQAGNYTVQFVATDNDPAPLSSYRNIEILVATCEAYSLSYAVVDQPCAGTSTGKISLSASGGYSPYTYSLDSGVTFQQLPEFENLAAGTYTGLIKDAIGCLSDAASIELKALPLPGVTLALPPNVCVNAEPLELTGGNPSGGSYSGTGVDTKLFYPDKAGVGKHMLAYTYTDSNGCSNTATKELVVRAAPVAEATAADSVVYLANGSSTGNSCTTLTGSATGGTDPYDFLWSTGETTSAIDICPSETTTYRLKVTDFYGCSGSDEETVAVEERAGGGSANQPEEPGNGYGAGNNPGQRNSGTANSRTSNDKEEEKTPPIVASKTNEEGITVFPNPLTDVSTVKVMLEHDDRIVIELIDFTGQVSKQIYSGAIAAGQELSFNIGKQVESNRIYSCRMITSSGVHVVKLIN